VSVIDELTSVLEGRGTVEEGEGLLAVFLLFELFKEMEIQPPVELQILIEDAHDLRMEVRVVRDLLLIVLLVLLPKHTEGTIEVGVALI